MGWVVTYVTSYKRVHRERERKREKMDRIMRVAVAQRRLDYVSFSLSHMASGERDRFNPLSAAGISRYAVVRQ
jgi:hypothetical protein